MDPSRHHGVPRLALRVEEAAASLGISDDAYREHVAPFVRIVRRGRLKLVAVRELERFLDDQAERLLDDRQAA
jgi:hypothetical protein